MKQPALIAVAFSIAAAAALLGIFAQRQQLAGLRDQQRELSAAPSESLSPPTSEVAAFATSPTSPELLDLRGQVSQMTARKRDLSIPADGFIRKNEAKWVGSGRPEDTFQSAVWALHNRRLDALLQLVEPHTAERLREQIGNSPDKYFDEAARVPAMRLLNLQFFGAATMRAQFDLGADDRVPRQIFFFLLDGQWKIVLDNPNARFTP